MAINQQEISHQLEGLVADHGLFLEDVNIIRAGKHSRLQVVVDKAEGPGGVDSDALEGVTRAISAWCDEVDPINGTYNLEVTTPGIERPLTQWRHFSRALTHDVRLHVGDEVIDGVLSDLDDTTLTLTTRDGSTRKVDIDAVDSAQMVINL